MTEMPGRPSAPFRDQPGEHAALIVIDMINPFDFAGGVAARAAAERAATAIVALRGEADRLDVPTIYVNDNFGEWHSEKSKLVEQARPGLAGGAMAPRDRDYFILKPQFSGFYSTNLAVLLPKLGVRRLILTGIATEICVLFTAADAHMRDYTLWVPEDAVAPLEPAEGRAALAIMRGRMDAEVAATRALPLGDWLEKTRASG